MMGIGGDRFTILLCVFEIFHEDLKKEVTSLCVCFMKATGLS